MINQRKIIKFLEEKASSIDSNFVEKILEANALNSDLEDNNSLLKKLVFEYAILEKQYFELNNKLAAKQSVINEDFKAARQIQRTLLPKDIPNYINYNFYWQYIPCDTVGGDLVNIVSYDEDNLICYIIDVSGHGPRSAMITVALSQFFSQAQKAYNSINVLSPSSVLEALDKEFPFSRFESFFTIIYGVLNTKTGNFCYCNSAHPMPILVQLEQETSELDQHDPMLGLGLCKKWTEYNISLKGNKKIFLYTDGLVECKNHTGSFYSIERLLKNIEINKSLGGNKLVSNIEASIFSYCGNVSLDDDFTYLLIENNE